MLTSPKIATEKPDAKELLRQDMASVADILRGLSDKLPGRVDPDLIAFLDGVATNPLALDLLFMVAK